MNIASHRPWITPLVIGTFLLSAVTGVLMFFHADSGLNKAAHEWLSWGLLAGVGLHLLMHKASLFRYFKTRLGLGVVSVFAALLALSFIPFGGSGEPPFAAPIRMLSEAPLPKLAQVMGLSDADLSERLRLQGYTGATPGHTLASLVGSSMHEQVHVLNRLTAKP